MLENLFAGLRAYAGKWSVDESKTRVLNSVELDGLEKAEVVSSEYGNSCCFFFDTGYRKYVPMDTNDESVVGDLLDIHKLKVITLFKEGETPIRRIRKE